MEIMQGLKFLFVIMLSLPVGYLCLLMYRQLRQQLMRQGDIPSRKQRKK